MRRFLIVPLAVSLLLGVATLPARASDASDIDAAAQRLAQAFNAQDRKAWTSLEAPSTQAVVDDFGLHFWSGPNALSAWFGAYFSVMKSGGMTDAFIAISPAKYIEVDGKRAWATFPTTYTYKDHGVAKRENGVLIFALQKQHNGWRFLSMSWGRLS